MELARELIYQKLRERQLAESSLYEFTKQAWPQIEGATKFIPGWHIEAICEHLEAATRGHIKKLLISVPPRTSKTTIISIMWPAWAWLSKPGLKFLYASYAQKISWDHSRLCRMLIESEWYRLRSEHIFSLSDDQVTKGHFTNTAMGHRIATSVESGGTALGGDVLVMDDPNDAGESKVTRDSTNDWVSRVWPSRLNPGGLGLNVLVQQRTDEMDVSGFWMSRDDNNEIVKLILPMEFEEKRRAKTIILPSSKKKIWKDPRTEEGELLCPAYINKAAIARKKIELGSYNYAGQYQQRPAPEEGGIIKKKWFKWWMREKPPRIQQVIQSWDCAMTEKDGSWSACTTWGLFQDDFGITNLILLNMWRDKVEYPELRHMAKKLYEDYRNNGSVEIIADGKHVPDMFLVEDKASGIPLIQDLRRGGIAATKFNPGPLGDKLQRVRLISHIIEAGRIWVPSRAPDYKSLLSYANTFVEICAMFPNSDSTDIVDTLTQVIHRTLRGGDISHPTDIKPVQKKSTVSPYSTKAS